MIAELQGASGLCNIIARLFIKFNSLLETACTHDVATDWCDCGSPSPRPEHETHQHVNTRPSSCIGQLSPWMRQHFLLHSLVLVLSDERHHNKGVM